MSVVVEKLSCASYIKLHGDLGFQEPVARALMRTATQKGMSRLFGLREAETREDLDGAIVSRRGFSSPPKAAPLSSLTGHVPSPEESSRETRRVDADGEQRVAPEHSLQQVRFFPSS